MENDDECPICFKEYSREKRILKDGNKNHEIESNCSHWFCCECLYNCYKNNIFRCPLCRGDIEQLVYSYNDYYGEEEEEED